MVTRRRSSRTVSRGTRRKLIWARVGTVGLVVPAPPVSVRLDLLQAFEATYGAQLIGCTVMRIRGFWRITGTTATIVTGIRTHTIGERTDPEGPVSLAHADWMHYDVQNSDKGGGHYFDVKAMRKIDELEQGLIMSFEDLDQALGTGSTVEAVVSTLVALP